MKSAYFGTGEEILHSLLIPALSCAVRYDRLTGYFTLNSLLAIAQGVDALYRRRGKMRLVIGIQGFPKDLANAIAHQDSFSSRVASLRERLVKGITTLTDSFSKDLLATVLFMIEDNLLEIKAVDTNDDFGIFHSKMLFIEDESGDSIAAIGSLNETANGLGGNVENLIVLKSWTDEDGVLTQQDIFEQAWSGNQDFLTTMPLTKELAEDILQGLGEEFVKQARSRICPSASLTASVDMPEYFFVSGAIPALYQHQEQAVLTALSRWPVRALFADEVGLGKTFEAAATLTFLLRFSAAKRAVLLTPKSVLLQWQSELDDHFGVEAWLYNSESKTYTSPTGEIIDMPSGNPLGKGSPDVMLISAQFARGSGKKKDIFSRQSSILPDILIVDEAHAARVTTDISGKRTSTKLFNTLKQVSPKIPHLILATATPMQKDSDEYRALLSLLGLPGKWKKPKAFRLALNAIEQDEAPALSTAASAAHLLLETVNIMHPSIESLDDKEASYLAELGSQDGSINLGNLVIEEWPTFKTLFIKLNPMRLLTVRNTRTSLEAIGYSFPKRNLIAATLFGYPAIEQFYDQIEEYISSNYLGIERILYPDKRFSNGFVRSSYQQRLASSLHSCAKTLQRRKERLELVRDALAKGLPLENILGAEFDDEDQDAALADDRDVPIADKSISEIDNEQIQRAANIELADINQLISKIKEINKSDGDPKVEEAIKYAQEYLRRGDSVLLFSRYTDTISALINCWNKEAQTSIRYGVYTGKEALIVDSSGISKTTKDEIKHLLERSGLRIIFCSDAASEGLNLQAARVLINVDVPWTPARLEQRIGRVARLGQRAQSVDIINVWYPNSVEAKMYGRISQRLKKYQIAIGEFPEVVAKAIRDSILSNTATDNSLKTLQEIRNSLQIDALKRLWKCDNSFTTSSHHFREGLEKIIESRCNLVDKINDGLFSFTGPNGENWSIATVAGNDDTVCLKSEAIRALVPEVTGCDISNDPDGNPCCYSFNNSSVDPECLPQLLDGTLDPAMCVTKEQPKWLPDFDALDMSFAVETQINKPEIWPPNNKGDEY
ncbi:MAG: helicase-related protein [Coriobacteriales bacterium]